jgi:acetyl/propionyl-CoA carboxylase alpha subunit
VKRFVDGIEYELSDQLQVDVLPDRLIVHTPEESFTALSAGIGEAVLVSYKGNQYRVERKLQRARQAAGTGSGEMRAPMPGQIVDVRVAAGDCVKKGEVILVLEAMKTQQPFVAPFDGTVKSLSAVKGEQVTDGHLLAVVEAS